MRILAKATLSLFALLFFVSLPATASAAFSYSGRLFSPDDQIYANQSVRVRADIRAGSCYLYRAERNTSTDDNGHFSIELVDTAPTMIFAAGSLQNILSTTSSTPLSCFDTGGATTGGSFAPSSSDARNVYILVDVGNGFEEVDSQKLTPFYQSVDSSKLGGRSASEYLYAEVATDLNQNNLRSVFASGNSSKLLALINGSSLTYTKAGELAGKAIPALTSGQAMRRSVSGDWESFTPLASSDPLTLTSGSIGGAMVISTSGLIQTTGTISSNVLTTGNLTTRSLSIYDSDDSNFIKIVAPATAALTSNLTLALPASTGISGQVLGTSGNGVLQWVANGIVGGSGSVTSVHAGSGLVSTPAAGITSAGTIGLAAQGVETTHLKDAAVTEVKLETIAGLVAGTSGTTKKVPRIEVDTKGRVKAITELNIDGLLPSPSTGRFLKSSPTLWAAENIVISDVKNSSGSSAFSQTACAANQAMSWLSATDTFTCQNIGNLSATLLTSGTLDPSRLPASALYWQASGDGISYTSPVNGSMVTVGSSASTAMLTKGMVSVSAYGSNPGETGTLQLRDLSGLKTASFRAPDTVSVSYRLTLPTATGPAGTVMTTDGAGNLSWSTLNTFPLEAPSGAASSPSYSFAGDANTGIYNPSPDSIGITTGSAERMRITATGVGIGTPSPSRSLDIVGGASTNLGIGISNQNNSGRSGLDLIAGSSGVNYASLNVRGPSFVSAPNTTWLESSHRIGMSVAGTLGLSIHSNGNVGIKNDNPQYDLDVGTTGSVRALNFISTSDARLKTNVQPMPGLDVIRRLRGVKYDWIQSGDHDAGLLAQEVEQILPDAVRTDKAGYKGVKYQYILAPLVEAVKELDHRCEVSAADTLHRLRQIEIENERLLEQNRSLEERLLRLEKAAGIAP